MNKTTKRKLNLTMWDYLYWIMAIVPFVISAVFYTRLPDQVPTHWNAANEINGYSSRLMACFGIPAFMLAMAVLVNISFRIDPKRANLARSKELLQIVRWFIVLLAILVQIITVSAGLGREINVGILTSVPIGLLFIAIGNYMPRCHQNYVLGIKLPWTLNDEENWNKTHHLAGYIWTAGGILMVVCGVLGMAGLYFFIVLAIILIPTVYSYLLYRRKQEPDHDR